MNVELQAVYQIGRMVSKCPHLEPVIGSNDKTLLTDGHIDIHSSEEHSKATFEGRVNVQVKGRTIAGSSKPPRTYSISKIELDGYLKTHGVLHFAVFINPRTDKIVPTYILLSPFKIQHLIDSMGMKKQIGVRVRPLPAEPSAIEGIVKLALQAMDERPSMRIEAGQLKDLTSITLYTDGTLKLDAPVKLTRFEHDYTLVFETSGGMLLAVDEELIITPPEYVGEVMAVTVNCGDFVFLNPTRRRVDKDTVELELSEGLKIQKSGIGQGSSGSIVLTMRETLRERFVDLGFYLTCADKRAFSVDGVENTVEVALADNQAELRGHFEYLTTLMSLCEHLGADSSLVELGALEGKRGNQLVGLHGVLLEGGEVTVQHNGPAGRILQPVGRWSFQLLVTQGSDGKWLCRDLFHPELPQQFVASGKDEKGESHIDRVTPYDVLEPEHFPFTLNLHLDNIVNAYNSIIAYPNAANYANLTVLKLISAADEVDVRRSEFLEAALSLNNWLSLKQGDLPDHQINNWQIIARQGQLSEDQRLEVRSLKGQASRREIDDPILVETACAILLGDKEEVAYCVSRLDEDQRIDLQSWPIWNLHSA